MIKILKNSLFTASALIFMLSSQAMAFSLERYVDGVHYQSLENAETKSKTVVEFFSYACPHCYHLEPKLEAWLKKKPENVIFERVPAAWNKKYEVLAHMYYSLEAMGLAEALASDVFDAIHKAGKTFEGVDDAVAFLREKNVSEAQFRELWDSEAVTQKVGFSNTIFAQHKVRGVPAILVNGKYLTNVSMAGSEDELFLIVEFLLAK